MGTVAVCLLFTHPATADDGVCDPTMEPGVYLLTMGPGDQLFTVFGHNALYLNLPERHTKLVYNYGVFDAEDPNLLEGFLRGTQEYWLSMRTFYSMTKLYSSEDREVVSQRLALPPSGEAELATLLANNAKPENKAYVYHWFQANCTTKIRDILDHVLNGTIWKQHSAKSGVTKRDEVLRHVGRVPWLWLALNYAMATDSDRELTEWEAMFLPDRLRSGMDQTTVTWPDGEPRPLVASECVVFEGNHPEPAAVPPQRTVLLWIGGLILGLLFMGLVFLPHRIAVWTFALVFFVWSVPVGALGGVSLALWVERALPVFWSNDNLWLANPVALLVGLLVWLLPLRWKGGRRLALGAITLLAFAAVVGSVLSLVRGFPQSNLGIVGLFLPAWLGAWRAAGVLAHNQRVRYEQS